LFRVLDGFAVILAGQACFLAVVWAITGEQKLEPWVTAPSCLAVVMAAVVQPLTRRYERLNQLVFLCICECGDAHARLKQFDGDDPFLAARIFRLDTTWIKQAEFSALLLVDDVKLFRAINLWNLHADTFNRSLEIWMPQVANDPSIKSRILDLVAGAKAELENFMRMLSDSYGFKLDVKSTESQALKSS